MFILGALFWGFIPGYFMTGALFPQKSALSVAERVAIAILLSLASTTWLGVALSLLHLFTAPALWFGLLLITAVAAAAAIRRQFEWRAIINTAWQNYRSWKMILVRLVLLLTIVPFAYWTVQVDFPALSSSWYYYTQALEIAQTGTIPEVVTEYGTSMYFITNKIGFNLITATSMLTSGEVNEPISIMLCLQLFTGLMAIVGAWAFLRRLMRPTFVVFTILCLAWFGAINIKMAAYRGEATGIAVFFMTLYCIHRAFESPDDTRWSVLAAVAFGVSGVIHGVSGLVAVFFYAALTFVALAMEKRRFFQRVPKMALTTVLTGVLVLGTTLLVGEGGIANQEAVLGEQSYPDIPGITDPTTAFKDIVLGRWLSESPIEEGEEEFTSSFAITPGEILNTALSETTLLFESLSISQSVGLVLILAAIAIGWWRRRPGEYFSGAILIFFGLLMLWGLFFAYRYDTLLLADHPLRREFPYLQLFGAIALALGLDRLTGLLEQSEETKNRANILRVMALVVLFALLLPLPALVAHTSRNPQILGRYSFLDFVFLFLYNLTILVWLRFIFLKWRHPLNGIVERVSERFPQRWRLAIPASPVIVWLLWSFAQPYIALPIIEFMLVLFAATILLAFVVDLAHPVRQHSTSKLTILAQCVLVIIWIVSFGSKSVENRYSRYTMTDEGYQAMTWLEKNSQSDVIVATNVRSTGVFYVYAERDSLMEGRAPYFQPQNLAHALNLLLDFHTFFTSPDAAVLEEYDVDYIVAAKERNVIGGDLFMGGDNPDRMVRQLVNLEELELCVDFGTVVVFEVNLDGRPDAELCAR